MIKIQSLVLVIAGYVLIGIIGFLVGYIIFGNILPGTYEHKSNESLLANNDENSIKREENYEESVESGENTGRQLSAIKDKDFVEFDITLRTVNPPMENKEEFIKWMLKNTPEEEKYLSWRWDCIQDLLAWNSIKDESIKYSLIRTPRENFIRERNKDRAYEHAYMPIGYGATITDPWIVSVMTQTIAPLPNHKVLEIGTGSGYQAAILSELTNYVYTIEIIEPLAKETNKIYRELEYNYPQYKNINRISGDGYYGWPEKSPFDRIIVTCSIDHIPPPLLKQLAPEGIMVIPVGPPSGQKLLKITKHMDGDSIYFDRENVLARKVHFISFTDSKGESYSFPKDDQETLDDNLEE